MMLLRIEQQKIRILKMSRDFTDLPTDKLADLKNKENFDRTYLRSLSQKSKNKRNKVRLKNFKFFLFHTSQTLTKTDRIQALFYSLSWQY
ncbi:MAG: hypothetical protein E6042_02035 [Haemophilus parainfluenzae]|nr:hypothetical protein [Haemophilus parainfluenzae]